VGFCGIFGLFSTPEQNPALKVLSTPAHPQVTQTVNCNNMGYIFKPSKIAKFSRVFDDSRLKRV
jgi:hypothetical protein